MMVASVTRIDASLLQEGEHIDPETIEIIVQGIAGTPSACFSRVLVGLAALDPPYTLDPP
jgi:hypothetical protein